MWNLKNYLEKFTLEVKKKLIEIIFLVVQIRMKDFQIYVIQFTL